MAYWSVGKTNPLCNTPPRQYANTPELSVLKIGNTEYLLLDFRTEI
jgi:hypothetical protein